MLPTFVIGLREGLEAALIISMIAAFLVREDRRDALRPMWTGVGVAIAICVAVGIGLEVVGRQLPERQQEMLATVVGLVAVAMITFMIVWMCRHAAEMKTQLHGQAALALASGSVAALVAMAFFAVFREGFETAVFLAATFNSATNPAAAGTGALLGLLVAVAVGIGIYKGGVRINLERFFRLTAAVLVLVAAGLLATSLHTAFEAGWIGFGQGQALDLSWLVHPDTVSAALLTGMLGLRPKPTQVELLGYLLYAVPMLIYVLWPRKARPRVSRENAEQPAPAVEAVAS